MKGMGEDEPKTACGSLHAKPFDRNNYRYPGPAIVFRRHRNLPSVAGGGGRGWLLLFGTLYGVLR